LDWAEARCDQFGVAAEMEQRMRGQLWARYGGGKVGRHIFDKTVPLHLEQRTPQALLTNLLRLDVAPITANEMFYFETS